MASQSDPNDFLNHGIIAHIPPPRSRKRGAQAKTLLITGLARSGTSMLAALLQATGVWLGHHVYEPVNEDAEIAQMLRARDLLRLDALIKRQNAGHRSGASRCPTCTCSCSTVSCTASATRTCW